MQNLHKIIPTSQGSLMLPGRPTSPSPKSKAGAKALTSAKALHDLCSYPPNEATKRNKATKCNKMTKCNKLCTSDLKTGQVDIMGYRMIL